MSQAIIRYRYIISLEEAKNPVSKIKFKLKTIVRKHLEKRSGSHHEAKFILSKIQ